MANQVAFKFRKDMSIGDNAAEYDTLLRDAFLDTGDLDILLDTARPASVIVGRTGSGKTALITMLTERADRVLRVQPENLSMQYLSNTTVIAWLLERGVHLDVFYQLLWRHVLVMELIRDHFSLRDAEGQQNFFRRIADSLRFNKSEQKALKYYNEFNPEFWEESDVRVRQITDAFSSKLAAELGATPAQLQAGMSETSTVSDEVVQRAHRVVREISLQQIQQGMDILRKHVLADRQRPYYIVIDDLDKNWVEHRMSYDLIDNLLDVVGEFARMPNVKIVVALRDNIVEALHSRRGKQSQQREKHESLFLRLRWSNDDLVALVDARLERLVRGQYGGQVTLEKFLPPARPYKTRTRAPETGAEFVMERTFRRPRDLIDFINRCVQEAVVLGADRITWPLLQSAEKKYSAGRLRSLEDEWHPTYPDIGRIFKAFIGISDGFTLSALQEDRLFDILDHGEKAMDPTSLTRKCFEEEIRGASAADIWRSLLPLLFRVSFLGVRPIPSSPIFWSYEGIDGVQERLSWESKYYVHPALRESLNIRLSIPA